MKNIKCGLLGEHLGHSFSPQIHKQLADYSYELFEMPVEDVPAFLKSDRFDAMNVTIPYKKTVMPYLDEITDEAKRILALLPTRAYKIALCVEGKQLSSEAFAEKIDKAAASHSEIIFIIGSSHGLSDSVKSACDARLSISEMTFPHQLMRVIMAEAIYRALNILKGTKYHK